MCGSWNWATDKGDKIHFYVGKNKANASEYLAKGNVDEEVYIIKGSRIASLESGLTAFKKEHFELPPIDENTEGFESLPVDVQRKLLDATKNRNLNLQKMVKNRACGRFG